MRELDEKNAGLRKELERSGSNGIMITNGEKGMGEYGRALKGDKMTASWKYNEENGFHGCVRLKKPLSIKGRTVQIAFK